MKNEFNLVRGDLVVESPFVLDAVYQGQLDAILKYVPHSKQVGPTLVELPTGLVITLIKVSFSAHLCTLTVKLWKTKQSNIQMKESIALRLGAESLNGLIFSRK